MKIEIVESKNFKQIAPLVEEVQNLHARLFPSVYKVYHEQSIKEVMERMWVDGNCKVYIARYNGEAIGYMMLLVKEVPDSAFHYASRTLHIDQIAVSGKHQKVGIGSMLMDEAEALAKQLSIQRLELDHLHLNTDAASFFSRRAFAPYRNKLCKILR